MAQYELLLPKMGESVAEATIIKWVKQPGDSISMDESVLEIATDKVDSEVPSPTAGKLVKQLFKENDVVQVGDVIALIETDSNVVVGEQEQSSKTVAESAVVVSESTGQKENESQAVEQSKLASELHQPVVTKSSGSARFYSPLVKSIAAREGISSAELDQLSGTGAEGRVTKQDVLNFIKHCSASPKAEPAVVPSTAGSKRVIEPAVEASFTKPVSITSVSGGDEIIEMDRMRKLIADHMVMSKHTSPHVTSFVEADVTNIVKWRDQVKAAFEKREVLMRESFVKYFSWCKRKGFTPLFANTDAFIKAMRKFPPTMDGICANSPLKVNGQTRIFRFSLSKLVAEGVEMFKTKS